MNEIMKIYIFRLLRWSREEGIYFKIVFIEILKNYSISSNMKDKDFSKNNLILINFLFNII